ncbi:MAG: helix-turn-helix domain-containing protein [Clostridia bacterium]|nr:helix-turn-helix domain-containing protein [Clostridia bacterium]MBQ8792102.1 helix-turn-helix domain-containing protein [Clostridia bacterium]
MVDFIQIVKDILEEQGKSLQNLFEDKVISENTFYKYKQRYPSLKTLIKIINYLGVSMDYLFELADENKFSPYVYSSETFYNNLHTFLEHKNISGRKFCNDLHYSRDNLTRWKKGTMPSVQILLEIAKYFNCTLDDLIKE